MSTRAAYCNSQHRSSATRAAHASGHRSASDTPSSGRERRRQGKTRMLKRIAELEARVRVLLDIIAQLSTHAETPPGLAQPEIFDVFDLTEEQASVACQTDISVDWSKPDVFVALPPSLTTAHADAAAGAGPALPLGDFKSQNLAISDELFGTEQCTLLANPAERLRERVSSSQSLAYSLGPIAHEVPCKESQVPSTSCVSQCGAEPQQFGSLAQPVAVGANEFDTITTRSRNLTSVSQDVGTWQALDATNAKHQVPDVQTQCGPLPQDFNSQDLADSSVSEPLEVVTPGSGPRTTLVPRLQTQCGPLPHDFNSQDLADSSVSELLEVVTPSSGPGPPLEPRLAPDVDNSRHLGQDILPTQCGLLPQEYNSQNLANSSGSELLEVVTPSSGPCTTLEPRLAPVVVLSRHHGQNILQTQCGPLPQDFNSQDLANSSVSEPLEVVTPCSGPCATLEPRLAPDVDHSRHRGQVMTQCGPLPQDFNSQDLAASSVSELLEVVTPCSGPSTTQEPRLAPDVDNSRHRGQDKTQCGPLPQVFNSQDLADSSVSELLEVVTPSSGPCTTHEPRLAPDVGNSRHRGQGTSEATALSFGPSAHELQKTLVPQQTVCRSANSHLEPPHECRDVFDSIVKVYTLRKRPTSRHLQEAVAALVRVAKMHGVSLQVCAQYVKAQSLALWCALESHRHEHVCESL